MSLCPSFQVLIKVIDTNDHRPQFSTSKYEVSVPEDTEPETEILQISAVDRDEKNKLIYTLQSSIDPASLKKFRLDPATGALYTSEKLDHEAIHQHVLTVMVRTHLLTRAGFLWWKGTVILFVYYFTFFKNPQERRTPV